MLLTLGILVGLFVGGGIFFAGGLEARRKAPYPYRRVDMAWQFGVGGIALLIATLAAVGLLVSAMRSLFG